MERSELLVRLAAVRAQVRAANPDIIHRLITRRRMHIQVSHRSLLVGSLINRLRRKLLLEVERGLEPVLSAQWEINLRLLREIEDLKTHLPSEVNGSRD